MAQEQPVQDLSTFRLPADFRGRSALVVQVWWLSHALLFRTSPQFMYGWRNWLLRCFGARIGKGVIIRPTVRITYPWKLTVGDHAWVGDFAELYTLDTIIIGDNAVVSQHAYLCTGSHDLRSPDFAIYGRPITVEAEAWVAAGAFVHPGVTIAQGSVVAARSIVRANTEAYGIYAGEPLRRVGERRARA